MELPESFKTTVIATYDDGGPWLKRLPDLIQEMAVRWSLEVEPAFPNLSYNYVAPAVRSDGTEAVLKLGPPNPDLRCEMEALKLYAGEGAVRLLEFDSQGGALLIERIRPGVMLSTVPNDSDATSIAGGMMQRLWRPLTDDHPFPSLARWFQSLTKLRGKFDGGTGPLPARLFEEAERLYKELLASQTEQVLLHGDLHHFNVLTSTRDGWLVIDPKGIRGERAFDTAQFMLNPWPDLLNRTDPGHILARRVDQLADDLGLDRYRIRGWGIANAMLSACWSVEDGGDLAGSHDLACAELLSGIR